MGIKKVSGDGQFDNPIGIAVDNNDNIYVVDRLNHRIQVFTSEGNLFVNGVTRKW